MPTDTPLPSFTRWPFWRRWFGRRSERAAAAYLRKQGYRIVACNHQDRRGEIDLIAIETTPQGKTLVIVEVRSTEKADVATVAATVDSRKQQRLTEATLRYLKAKRLLGQAVRFDVLVIRWPTGERTPEITHYPNAFEATGRFQIWS